MNKSNNYEYLLGSLDIKDAFLQVAQKEPLRIELGKGQYRNQNYIVLRNLLGQRLGARAWFDHLSEYLQQEADFQHCPLNPCLARNDKMMLLVHVDNVMLMGDKTYVHEIFLPLLKKKFDLSCELLKDAGDSILFLKRLYTRVDDGIVVKPGNYIQKMLEAFEERFGMVRIQQVPSRWWNPSSRWFTGVEWTRLHNIQASDRDGIVPGTGEIRHCLLCQRACFKDCEAHNPCTSAFEETLRVSQRNPALRIEAYQSSTWSGKADPQ